MIYLACGDPAILNIGVMIDPASSDWKKGVNYSLILSKFKYYIKKGEVNLQHFPLLNKTLNRSLNRDFL